ncbi:LysR family transcriptional regulator [Pseudomonas sp. HMWF032]|uniref:LysR family transcriptional regulator n=1 Tax=Pseudomonas sp. HMWF032 TaxID=2056866 RepID=UPI000D3344AF|nr:LysR family transcriptional regulator [Pseudomonas sp. HMWF032]PTS82047.1 LysR family transcriptional regulator [Pseudomonas sp. HMWF032]PTT85751.1 LysR family transcriptional regulator [Pseudomonas sp. HMWF010]
MNKLPDLEAWAIFAKVAQTGSFVQAATELSLSQGTVSKAITRLEARVRSMLFHRTSRSMTLTDSGVIALEFANKILEEGLAVEAELTEQAVNLHGQVRVTAPMSFGLSYVAPALPGFMAQYPDIALDIDFSDALVDLIEQRFDLAIRIAKLSDSSLLARRLCTVRILLVGSPAYFEQHGRPRHPRDLAGHRALQYAYSPKGESWRFQHPQHGEFTQTMHAPLRVNNAEALVPALHAGLGLALQPEFLAWQEIQSGRLETAIDDWEVEPIALHLVTPPGRRRPARVQTLIDYLGDYFATVPWAHGTGPEQA